VRLDALAKPGIDGGRFFLVDYLPTYAAALLLATLVWAGAPGPLEAGRAWRTASSLGIGELVLAALAVTLLAVLVHPFQLALVRLLEGQWPEVLGPLTRWSRRRQVVVLRRLARLEELPDDGDAPVSEARVQEAGRAGAQRRLRFPAEELCRPTALGNVLAAMETRAGDAYGFDAVVAWPRLYPVLGERVRTIVDDRRNTVDAAARLSVTMLVTGLVAAVLLAFSGWWVLLAVIPLALSWIASRAAVHAAMAYSEAVDAAFDLHRFDLMDALHLPLPADDEAERSANAKLCDFWRQGLESPTKYQHRDVPPPQSSR
jgi:hypothetical protein